MIKVEINFTDKHLEEQYGWPTYGTEGAAAVDLRACPIPEYPGRVFSIWPSSEMTFSAGFKMSMPQGVAALIIPRSGQGWKHINLANSTGLIDSDYQGEIKIKLVNRGTEPFIVEAYDRIAQMIFVPYFRVEWDMVKNFTKGTARGEGGFGSTGVS